MEIADGTFFTPALFATLFSPVRSAQSAYYNLKTLYLLSAKSLTISSLRTNQIPMGNSVQDLSFLFEIQKRI